jgi:uncharacterized protein YjbI with pentapeptide repeats
MDAGENRRSRARSGLRGRDFQLATSQLATHHLRALPLSFADLSGADLSGANLSYAHVRGARGISAQQLHEQCKILIGATVPNGQKYEEWTESKGLRQ